MSAPRTDPDIMVTTDTTARPRRALVDHRRHRGAVHRIRVTSCCCSSSIRRIRIPDTAVHTPTPDLSRNPATACR